MKINKYDMKYYLLNTLELGAIFGIYRMTQNFHPTNIPLVDYSATLLLGGYVYTLFEKDKQEILKDRDKNKPKDITRKL